MRRFYSLLAVFAWLTLFGSPLIAEENPPPIDPAAELQAAMEEVNATLRPGPQDIDVVSQARLNLPAKYAFVPAAAAARLLTAFGNRPGNDLVGLVVPNNSDDWLLVIRYTASGYIRDDDARDWQADELLKDIRNNTDSSNAERRRRNLAEIEVVGWVEAPQYDKANHRAVWSVASRPKGQNSDDASINYNTLLLGREGHISMNLVTRLKDIEERKPIARQLLGALEFKAGKRYVDFNDQTDKVAEYGLAALVAGVAAKKLGFFGFAALFLAKFGKIVAVAALAVVAGAVKLWRNKS
ncbi:MAG TPA: DUF2167 domain-containing protein [Accumulibacter sp.]|nr:DUF2167 domain-containing protein [Accumulibacter sp.]HMW16730.1 DUF2167 domain-containing protein [Accumulibacter sp.]HMX21534.1 DUF2167 domain-containing protein [Accumulibacter sp.]HNC18255.1 DUF2167 domain-containing protein [Accumulibacter sp.]HND79782.1 DUF2167 domain-containing protein [Accumulibacter sp.]